MSQHTAGPWVATGNYVKTDAGAICTMAREGVIQYAAATGSLEDSANARLIASAPELLELARRLVVWMEHTQTGGTLDFKAIGQQARTAIATAEGRE